MTLDRLDYRLFPRGDPKTYAFNTSSETLERTHQGICNCIDRAYQSDRSVACSTPRDGETKAATKYPAFRKVPISWLKESRTNLQFLMTISAYRKGLKEDANDSKDWLRTEGDLR